MAKLMIFPLIVILIGLNACTQGLPIISTPIITSGIEGYVTKGPMCPGPVQIGSEECKDQPYQAIISILDASYNQITQIQTDDNGYFKILLAAGTYILHPESGNPLPIADDQTVIVTGEQFIQVSIQYDTGIR